MPIVYENLRNYHIETQPELQHITCNWYDLFQEVLDRHYLLPPVEGSQCGVNFLKTQGYKIVAVTARWV